MEEKSGLTPEILKTLGLDKKYHILREGAAPGRQVNDILNRLNKAGGSEFALRFFGNARLLDMLFSGTDKVTEIIFADPALERHGPRYDNQVEIMRKKGLKGSDVIWALYTKRDDLSPTIDEHLKNDQSVAVYRLDQLERLDTSFYRFKGKAHDALIDVFGYEEISDAA